MGDLLRDRNAIEYALEHVRVSLVEEGLWLLQTERLRGSGWVQEVAGRYHGWVRINGRRRDVGIFESLRRAAEETAYYMVEDRI